MRNFQRTFALEAFDLGFYIKSSVKMILICLVFSAAFPICYLFVLIGLFASFWIYKLILIKYSGKPPPYSNQIVENMINILKFTFIMKSIFTILFMSNHNIYPTVAVFNISSLSIEGQNNDSFLKKILNRSLKVFPITLILLLFLGINIFHIFVFKVIKKLYLYFFNKNKVQHYQGLKTYKENMHKIATSQVKDYFILNNKIYKELLSFNSKDLRKIHTFIKSTSIISMLEHGRSIEELEEI